MKKNLIVFDMDGISVAHLGDIEQVPEQKEIEALGQVNILLTPVGGGNSLNAAQAAELVSLFEPNIVVPMHYGAGIGNKNDGERFAKLYKGETAVLKPV